MPTQHPPELVERVAKGLFVAYEGGHFKECDYDAMDRDEREWWAGAARYALDLAERAARHAQELADADRFDGATSMSEDAIKTLAVRRAVGGA